MEYPLSITSLSTSGKDAGCRTPLTCVMAEADLGPYTDFGSPEFFFGRLVEVTADEIDHLRQAPGVEVHFRGTAYQFEALETSATFKLVRKTCDGQ